MLLLKFNIRMRQLKMGLTMNIEGSMGIFLDNNQLLLDQATQNCILPINDVITKLAIDLQATDYFYLGEYENKNIYVIHINSLTDTAGYITAPLRHYLVTIESELAKLILRGKQLVRWHQFSLYCGRCGNQTKFKTDEIAKLCEKCDYIIYPHTHPAVIVLIQREDKILLARPPHFNKGIYSTLAGFVNPGESCEDAIHREVYEEVGIKVKDITYFGSQSWPFPNSFMLGFKAYYAGGEIYFHDHEIEDAKWFTKENLPLLPHKASIARQLIDSFC